MKKLFFLLTALLPSLAFAQDSKTFTINGKTGNLNAPAKVYLLYQFGANKVVDSSAVVNGSFTITGTMFEPGNAYLVVAHKNEGLTKLDKLTDVLAFYLDKGSMTVTNNTDSVYSAKITGSVINDENRDLGIQLKAVNDDAQKLDAEQKSAPQSKQNSPEFQREINVKAKELQSRQKSILQGFVVTHPNSYLGLLILNQLGREGIEPAEIETLFNALNPDVKNTESGKSLEKSITTAKITAIGAIAPDFTQPDVNGNPVKLSSFRGKYVLIDFWASWCGPCRMESPAVVKAFNKYKDKNFTILGVSLDRPDAKTDWLGAIKKDGLNWTQVSDLKFWGNEAAVLYFVQSIPANFLLDPNGKIIAKDLRGTDLEDKLAELFGK
jgi:peroxiredoxin